MFLETIFPQHVDWIYSLNHIDSKKKNPQATGICFFLKERRSVKKCSFPYCFSSEEKTDYRKKRGKKWLKLRLDSLNSTRNNNSMKALQNIFKMLFCRENIFPVLFKMIFFGFRVVFMMILKYLMDAFVLFLYSRHKDPLASALTHTRTHI